MRRTTTTADAPSRTRLLTTTEAAVLALLAIEGENSGYDLLKHVRQAIAYVWAPARSQLYSLLPRLVTDGYARSRDVAQSGRPDKTLYKITPAGRAALDEWLAADSGDRETFFLRLFVGGLADDETLIEQVERFRAGAESRLEELRAIEPTNTREGNDYYHYFLLRLGIERYQHDLDWADWVLAELRRRRR